MVTEMRSRGFIVLWFLMFLATFSISMIGSPVAFLIRNYAGSEEATALAMGFVLSLGPAALTVGYFLGGFLADKVGRKKLMLVSLAIMSFGFALFIAAQSILIVYLAYFTANLANGLIGPIFACLVADCSKQSSRGTAYGVFNLSWALAQIPAPVLGGVIFDSWSNMPWAAFLVAMSVSVTALVLSSAMKSSSGVAEESVSTASTSVDASSSVKPLMSYRDVVFLFGLLAILNGLLNGVLSPLLNIYPMYILHATSAELGLSVSLGFAAVTALVQIPGGKLTDKMGRKPLLLFGFLSIPLVLLIGLTQTLWQYILVLGGICALGNLSGPALSAWMMDLLPPEKRAKASGINGFISNFGRIFGPSIGSFMWTLYVTTNPLNPNTVIPFAVAAFFFAVQIIPVILIKETKTKTQ